MSWTFEYGGPENASRSVLLLPGGWCTAAFYRELLAAPELVSQNVRFIAATPPGFGDNPLPEGFDLTVESYAELVAEKVSELGCDLVAAHSFFANVSIEMAIAGKARTPLVLLSPAFSTEDEEKEVKQLDGVGRVPGLGRLAWAIFPHMIGPGMKKRFPEHLHGMLVAEMRKSPSQINRRIIRNYVDHLHHKGPLTPAFVDSGAKATVAFGDQDEVGLQPEERATLEAAQNVELVFLPDCHHFVMVDQPQLTLRLILDALCGGETKPE